MTTYFFRNIPVCNLSEQALYSVSREHPEICMPNDVSIQANDSNNRLDATDSVWINGSSLREEYTSSGVFTRSDVRAALSIATGLGRDNPAAATLNLQASVEYLQVKSHAERAMSFLSRNPRSQEILLALDRRAMAFNLLYPSQRNHLDIRPIYSERPANTLALANANAVQSALDLAAEILSNPTSAEDAYIPSAEEISLVYFLLQETKTWADANSTNPQREALLARRIELMTSFLNRLFSDPFPGEPTYIQNLIGDPALTLPALNEIVAMLENISQTNSEYRALPNYTRYFQAGILSGNINALKRHRVVLPLQSARQVFSRQIPAGQEMQVIPQVLGQLRIALDQAQTNSSEGIELPLENKRFIGQMLTYCRARLNALLRPTRINPNSFDASTPIPDAAVDVPDLGDVIAVDASIISRGPTDLLQEITDLNTRLAEFNVTVVRTGVLRAAGTQSR